MMQFTEIKISVDIKHIETASAIANMTVPYGIYIEDYSDLEDGVQKIAHIDLIDDDLRSKDKTKAIIHIYLNECDHPLETITYLSERFAALGIKADVKKAEVEDTDWNENWKKYFKPFEVGDKLAVCPSWEKYDNKDNRFVIKLDPGAAFGTGTHATTALCMELLQKYVNNDTTVLDIGTGSGILCISALLLGAKSAFGVDIDELSVKTAKENAKRNGVNKKCDFIVGDLAKTVEGRYNIVCANIVADVVIRLLQSVKNYMEKDGILIVSGIIDVRKDDLLAAIPKYGFRIEEHLVREEWHAYVLRSL
ncbi:MAG: 50S ribosomal protein L11 methyltransferase [Clostridia bacterium]|nr:50S ribosomal protein L11 methyltransferase [Clostridia bacterium]